MFANDPFQTQPSLGTYMGAMNPFTSPYAGSMQGGFTQPQSVSPFGQQGYGGFPNYNAIAPQPHIQQQLQQQLHQLQQIQQIQQLQALASILASQGQIPGSPWQMQQQPGVFQSPLQNPLIAATLQNPLLLQHLTQQQNPFAQSGYPLAPQSWVGQHHSGRGIY